MKTKNSIISCLIAFAIFIVLGASNGLVPHASAQETESTAVTATDAAIPGTGSATLLPVDTIFSSQENPERVQQLKILYQALVEDYGVKLRQFNLNRAQWQSLQTLRSLEEAVLATTAVLSARNKTMITYYELLFEALDRTPGIELTIKQEVKNALLARIEWLRQHDALTQTAVDRNGVNLRSDEYTAQAEVMTLEIRKALQLIRLGQLQTTFDRSNGLYQRILDRNTAKPGTALQQVERARAYVQVELLRAQIQRDLQRARESLDERTAERGREQTDYAGFIAMLEQPYANASKYLSYLEELARDTW